MRHLNKMTSVFCAAALGVLALTNCEGGDLYGVDAPDWISEKVDSINNAKEPAGVTEIEGLEEDVYTIGNTDYSSGWWSSFSKYYVIPDGEKWTAQFNLNINPSDNTYYKNFALIISTDADRGAADYKEYGAFRFDCAADTASYNSQWGSDYYKLPFKFTESNQIMSPVDNADAGLQKLGGKVTLIVDRSDASKFTINISNANGVVKTYNQPYPLSNLNADVTNTNVRCFLCPEGSYISFLGSTIEPIGGFTSAEDKLPLSMTLNGVPRKVLQGSEVADAFKNITATVQFETGVSKEVTSADLTFEAIPDMVSLGTKTLVVVYNKTYKGENCNQPIIAYASFEVVDKMYTSIGATDNSTGWWGAHSENVKVAPGETFVTKFTNYTSGVNSYNNFVVVLCAADNTEYAVVRSDNFGWGTGYDGNANLVTSGGQADWATWLAAMDGAKVTTYVTNNGDGTADVKAVMVGNDGVTYYQDYIGINTINPDDFYFRFTVDGCHLEFDNVVGAEDNTTTWWSVFSDLTKVPAGATYTTRFRNYTNGATNWNNFVIVLTREDKTEYAVLRADNFGWGACYEGNGSLVTSGGQTDWATWLAAMNEALVTVSVINKGDGTADVKAVMEGNDGNTYYQDYIGLTPIDADDFHFMLTIEGGHITFE